MLEDWRFLSEYGSTEVKAEEASGSQEWLAGLNIPIQYNDNHSVLQISQVVTRVLSFRMYQC